MKKLIMCLLVAGTFTTAAIAQDSTKSMSSDKMGKMHQMKDCVMMKDGKLATMTKDGITPLTKDLTLTNGTVINTTGIVTAKDGSTITLTNGQAVDMDGKLITKKDGNKMTTAPAQK